MIEQLCLLLCNELNMHSITWHIGTRDNKLITMKFSTNLGFYKNGEEPGEKHMTTLSIDGKPEKLSERMKTLGYIKLMKQLNLTGDIINDMQMIRDLCSTLHTKRKNAGIKVRQPLQGITL